MQHQVPDGTVEELLERGANPLPGHGIGEQAAQLLHRYRQVVGDRLLEGGHQAVRQPVEQRLLVTEQARPLRRHELAHCSLEFRPAETLVHPAVERDVLFHRRLETRPLQKLGESLGEPLRERRERALELRDERRGQLLP